MGYSDTMQLMAKAGVNPVDGYHRGAPQIVHLDLECKGEPLVKQWKVPTNEVADYSGKRHLQFNAMCVCTLKVAKKDRHGLTTQPQNTGITDFFGFLGSQNSVGSMKRRGGDGDRALESVEESTVSSTEEAD